MHTKLLLHYNDVIMSEIASHITSLTIVYSIVYSDADQRIHQSSASLAFVREIQRGPVNSPHKCPVTRKMFPFDDVIMNPEVRGPMKRLIISYCLYGWFSYLELLIFFELRVINPEVRGCTKIISYYLCGDLLHKNVMIHSRGSCYYV